MSTRSRLVAALTNVAANALDRALTRSSSGTTRSDRPRSRTERRRDQRSTPQPTSTTGGRGYDYPGDFTGTPHISYTPVADKAADPGEIVWTWVPYEEDHSRGKDRPVLVIGHDGEWLLGLQVTSKDHDRDADQEARAGRFWDDIGSGAWDNQGRPSEVRLNRLIRIDPDAIRRIGAVLDEQTFNRIADGVRKYY